MRQRLKVACLAGICAATFLGASMSPANAVNSVEEPVVAAPETIQIDTVSDLRNNSVRIAGATDDTTSNLVAGKDHLLCTGTGTDGARIHLWIATPDGVVPNANQISTVKRIPARINADLYASSVYNTGQRATARTGRFETTVPSKNSCEPVVRTIHYPATLVGTDTVTLFKFLRSKLDPSKNVIKGQHLVFSTESDGRNGGLGGCIACKGTVILGTNPLRWAYPVQESGLGVLYSGFWNYRAATHELMHALGKLGGINGLNQLRPGNDTWNSAHCTDGIELLCYPSAEEPNYRNDVCTDKNTISADGEGTLVDCNGDTYFNPEPKPGSWLENNPRYNIANSSFLTVGGLPAVGTPNLFLAGARAVGDASTYQWEPLWAPAPTYDTKPGVTYLVETKYSNGVVRNYRTVARTCVRPWFSQKATYRCLGTPLVGIANTSVTYRVSAWVGGYTPGASAWSDPHTFAPVRAARATVVRGAAGLLGVKWGVVAGATSYDILWNGVVVAHTTKTATTLHVPPGATGNVTVRGCTALGGWPACGQASPANRASSTPSAPDGYWTAGPGWNWGSADVNWYNTPNTVGVRIQYKWAGESLAAWKWAADGALQTGVRNGYGGNTVTLAFDPSLSGAGIDLRLVSYTATGVASAPSTILSTRLH